VDEFVRVVAEARLRALDADEAAAELEREGVLVRIEQVRDDARSASTSWMRQYVKTATTSLRISVSYARM
jgi:hypothetical protein